jgi:hypothetical protein
MLSNDDPVYRCIPRFSTSQFAFQMKVVVGDGNVPTPVFTRANPDRDEVDLENDYPF